MNWDVICGIAILYSIVVVPYSIGFTTDSTPSESTSALNKLVDVIFFLDVCITFRTALFDPTTNLLVIDKRLIAKHYISFWFWIDIASTVPFDSIIEASMLDNRTNSTQLRTIKLLRILRLSRLSKLHRLLKSQSLKDFLERSHIPLSIVSVFVLALQIFLVAHIIACFWYFITTNLATGMIIPDNYIHSDDSNSVGEYLTWATEFNFINEDTVTQYIISLFWSFQTLLTVGYGDIHPTNTIERAYAFIVMLIGGLMFGTIIAKVGGKTNSFWIE